MLYYVFGTFIWNSCFLEMLQVAVCKKLENFNQSSLCRSKLSGGTRKEGMLPLFITGHFNFRKSKHAGQ